jgi:Glycosyl hydrolases family 16
MRGPWAVLGPEKSRQTHTNVTVVCCAVALLCTLVFPTARTDAASTARRLAHAARSSVTPYPIGVRDSKEPSYYAPPPWNALPGYARSFVDDFTKQPSPTEWYLFRGIPLGDPVGRFDVAHVSVNHGMLKIGTWQDPRFANQWVSGGVGLVGQPQTYGAYFVRSREIAPGPDTTELLWPQTNQPTPEIAFDESGGSPAVNSWFVNNTGGESRVSGATPINLVHWHTFGVIWSPTSITFTVDGRLWGKVSAPSVVPDVPMTLDIQSTSWCGIPNAPCPTADSLLLVDWVDVYTPSGT